MKTKKVNLLIEELHSELFSDKNNLNKNVLHNTNINKNVKLNISSKNMIEKNFNTNFESRNDKSKITSNISHNKLTKTQEKNNNDKSPLKLNNKFDRNPKEESKHNIPRSTIHKKPNFKKLSIIDLIEIKQIGSGAYSKVFLNKHAKTGELFAIKQIEFSEKMKKEIYSNYLRETMIHSNLNHENIIKLYDFNENNGETFFLILEYAEKGNLYKIIKKDKLTEKSARNYFGQILNAVHYLHFKGIIHRDIKPENILIDKNNVVKLCDFGLAVNIQEDEGRETFCGTYEYMAPEIIQNKPYNKKIDIWCLGILLYEILHGFSPFSTNSNLGNINNIMKNNNVNNLKDDLAFKIENSCIKYNDNISDLARDLIDKLLNKNPDDRISIDEIKLHPWMIDNQLEDNKIKAANKKNNTSTFASCNFNNCNPDIENELIFKESQLFRISNISTVRKTNDNNDVNNNNNNVTQFNQNLNKKNTMKNSNIDQNKIRKSNTKSNIINKNEYHVKNTNIDANKSKIKENKNKDSKNSFNMNKSCLKSNQNLIKIPIRENDENHIQNLNRNTTNTCNTRNTNMTKNTNNTNNLNENILKKVIKKVTSKNKVDLKIKKVNSSYITDIENINNNFYNNSNFDIYNKNDKNFNNVNNEVKSFKITNSNINPNNGVSSKIEEINFSSKNRSVVNKTDSVSTNATNNKNSFKRESKFSYGSLGKDKQKTFTNNLKISNTTKHVELNIKLDHNSNNANNINYANILRESKNSNLIIETKREDEYLDSLRDNRFNKQLAKKEKYRNNNIGNIGNFDFQNKKNDDNIDNKDTKDSKDYKRNRSKNVDHLNKRQFEKLENMLIQSDCLNILENASKNIKIIKEENFLDKFLNLFKPNLCGKDSIENVEK